MLTIKKLHICKKVCLHNKTFRQRSLDVSMIQLIFLEKQYRTEKVCIMQKL